MNKNDKSIIGLIIYVDNGRFHTYSAMFTDIGREYRISSVMECLLLYAECHLYVIQFTYLQASRLRN